MKHKHPFDIKTIEPSEVLGAMREGKRELYGKPILDLINATDERLRLVLNNSSDPLERAHAEEILRNTQRAKKQLRKEKQMS